MDDELRSPVLNRHWKARSSHNEISINWLETDRIVDPRDNCQVIEPRVDISQTDEKILWKVGKIINLKYVPVMPNVNLTYFFRANIINCVRWKMSILTGSFRIQLIPIGKQINLVGREPLITSVFFGKRDVDSSRHFVKV